MLPDYNPGLKINGAVIKAAPFLYSDFFYLKANFFRKIFCNQVFII